MKTTERRLVQREGAEGDRHDPYGWVERTVVLNGHRVTLRSGALGYDRYSIDGRVLREDRCRIMEPHVLHQPTLAEQAWLDLTGFESVDAFDKAYVRAHPYSDERDPYYGHA